MEIQASIPGFCQELGISSKSESELGMVIQIEVRPVRLRLKKLWTMSSKAAIGDDHCDYCDH